MKSPADLYPDVAAHGGLAPALEAVAAEHGLPLGEVRAIATQPLLFASVEGAGPREALSVHAESAERGWRVTGWHRQRIELIRGGVARDLAQVARLAHAWREGAPMREIRVLAPFVETHWLADAVEEGPAAVVAAQWDEVRREAREEGRPEHGELVEAAHAEPRLRRLMAYTSHWALRFTTEVGWGHSADAVCVVAPRDGGPFLVKPSYQRPPFAEAATAAEAVRIAVASLPESVDAAAMSVGG